MMKPIQIHWARVLPISFAGSFFILILYLLMRKDSCGTDYVSDPDIKAVSYICNSLSEGPANGDEGSVPTFKYRLEQVHITIRHGDRFLLHTLPNYDMIHIPCNVSKDLLRYVPEMEGYSQTMEEASKQMREDHPFVRWDLYPNKEVCKPSMLTPRGAAQHVRNGAFLKSVYLRKWKLLARGAELWDQVEMVSTSKSRTLQSGLALLYGFLPEFDITKLHLTSVADNKICKTNCDCPVIQRYLSVTTSVYGQWLSSFTAQSHVDKVYKSVAEVLGTPAHTLPFPSHIMDVSVVHMCNGLPLPGPPGRSKCMPPSTVRGIIDALNQNGAHHRFTPKVQRLARLKMFPFLTDVIARMEGVTSGDVKRRFYLYSGHDSTLDPLLLSLNVTDGTWPRYASRVIIELYSSASPTSPDQRDLFVKVLYDGKDVTQMTTGCQKLAPDGLCPLEKLKAALTGEGFKKLLNGRTYKEACVQPVL